MQRFQINSRAPVTTLIQAHASAAARNRALKASGLAGTRTQNQRLKRALFSICKIPVCSNLRLPCFLLLYLLLSAVRFPFKNTYLLGSFREKTLSPRRTPRRSLLPLSPKRTQVRLKSLLYLVWLTLLSGSRQIHSKPTDVLGSKSAVYGLNDLRPAST